MAVDTARIESSFGESNMQGGMCAVVVGYYLHKSCFSFEGYRDDTSLKYMHKLSCTNLY
jgi:hypothetical protein